MSCGQQIIIKRPNHKHPASDIINFAEVVEEYSKAALSSTSLYTNSSYWDNTYNVVKSGSACWNNACVGINTFSNVSGNYNSSYETVCALSANWNTSFDQSTVFSENSGSYNYQGTDIKSLTGDYSNISTVVKDNSAQWQQIYPETDPAFSAWALANSGNYQSNYNTVNDNSSNWQSGYSSYNSNSANILTYVIGDNRYVNILGDIMSGGLSAPSLSTSTLYVGASTIYFIDDLGNIVNSLKSNDVTKFDTNYTTILDNSANWNDAFNNSVVYSNNSSDYYNTNTFLQNTSAANNSVYSTVNTLSSVWNIDLDNSDVNSVVQNTSANWNNGFTSYNANSSTYQDVSNVVNANSAIGWNYQGNDVKSLTANYENISLVVKSNSAQWSIDLDNAYVNNFVFSNSAAILNVDGVVQSNSAQWATTTNPIYDGIYTTVNVNSATNWNYQGTDIKTLTGNWQNTFNTVFSNSGIWSIDTNTGDINVDTFIHGNSATILSVDSVVQTSSAVTWNYQGNDVKALTGNYSNISTVVKGNSAQWAQGIIAETDPVFITWATSNSANYQSTYSTVNTNSTGLWNYQGSDVKALTGNYSSVYTNVNSNSSSWNNVYTTVRTNSATTWQGISLGKVLTATASISF